MQVGARRHADHAPDGVYFVDLSTVTDADAAFDAVARAVGASGTGGPLDLLREHLAPAANAPGARQLRAGDRRGRRHRRDPSFEAELRILVTSREALRIRSERLFAVPTLTTPRRRRLRAPSRVRRRDGCSSSGHVTPVRGSSSPTTRPRTWQRSAFDSTGSSCDRAGGRPDRAVLAGQAAGPAAGASGVLGGDTRDLPERQQTLRSTIEWSERLLDEDERSTFRLFSVFASARIDAVEAVAARLEGHAGVDVLPRLVSLVDKSLVRASARTVTAGSRCSRRSVTTRPSGSTSCRSSGDAGARLQAAMGEGAERWSASHRSGAAGILAELEADLASSPMARGDGRLGRLDAMLDALCAHDDRGWYGAIALERPASVLARRRRQERTAQEITVWTSLARGLMAIRGYTQEVEDIYADVLARLRETGEPSDVVPLLRSLASLLVSR